MPVRGVGLCGSGRHCRRNGRRFAVTQEVAPHLAYMRMLAAAGVDGRPPLRMLRPAVKGRLPWRLDCSGLALALSTRSVNVDLAHLVAMQGAFTGSR